VNDSANEAQLYGITSTPAIFINGGPFRLSRDKRGFEAGFAMEASRGRVSCR
jgi:hypothetical protein